MVRAILLSAFSFSLSITVTAATYELATIPASLSDWKNAANYKGNAAPSGAIDEIVVLPQNCTVTVDGSNDDLTGFLSNLKAIYVTNAVLSVNVPEGKIVSLACAITDNSHWSGKLEKIGGGELKLTGWRRLSTSNSPNDYAVNIHVREGTLRLPDTSHSESGKYYNMYGYIKVDAGAKLVSITKSVWQVRGLAGAGLITNETSSVCDIYVTGSSRAVDAFYGALGGPFNINMRQNAYLNLAGQSSTFVNTGSPCGLNGTESGPLIHVAKFGYDAQSPSSVGYGSSFAVFSSGMRVVYTGSGETTHKNIYALNSPSYLDAGAVGGVLFAGDFATWSTSTGNLQRHLVLDGSNTSECVIAGRFDPSGFCVANNATNHWYISKRGSGTWRFTADDHKHLVGTFAVENGVLAFDSIFQKGVACALGTSTRTYLYHVGAIDENKRSDWAFELGCSTNSAWTGLMEYRGEDVAQCIDRKFALVGNGGFKSHPDAGAIRYADVTGVGEGSKMLVLDGNSACTNSLYNIRDGEGVVAISKRGAGVWELGGEIDVSGDVEVLGGTLIVRRAAPRYTRYRFVLKEIAAENPVLSKGYEDVWTKTYGYWCFNEIALYNQDGKRQNFHLAACSNRAALAPGQAAFATDRAVVKNEQKMSIAYLFDGFRKVVFDDGHEQWNGFAGYIDPYNPPNRNREDSYVGIDMYLTDDADVVTHYDVANSGIARSGSAGGRTASAFALYGSVDGINWDRLSESEYDEIAEVPASTYCWLYGPTGFNDNKDHLADTVHAQGWKLAKTVPDRKFKIMDDMGAVTVDNGGKLVFEGDSAPAISSLKLNAESSGAIAGFSFEENGTLELTGTVPKGGFKIPLDLSAAAGLANVSSWTVKVDGKTVRKDVRAKADGLSITDRGLVVTIR